MERHAIHEQTAFLMLRDEARRTHRKLIDLAEAVVTSHSMLVRPTSGPEEPGKTGEDLQGPLPTVS
jgi:hypothetical protein